MGVGGWVFKCSGFGVWRKLSQRSEWGLTEKGGEVNAMPHTGTQARSCGRD